MLKTETSNPKISFDNAIHLMVQHGPIVGVIHRIHPENTQSTFIFFWDEYVHEATGFACGEKNEHSKYLKSLISMIPGCNKNCEGNVLEMIGSSCDKLYNKAQEEKQTVHYYFSPDHKIGSSAIQSLGFKVYESYCRLIYTEDKGLSMSVELPND